MYGYQSLVPDTDSTHQAPQITSNLHNKKDRSPSTLGPQPDNLFIPHPFKAAPDGVYKPRLWVAVDAPHGLISVPVVRQAQKRPTALGDSPRRFSAPRAVLTLSVAAPLALRAVLTCATEALDSLLCRGFVRGVR